MKKIPFILVSILFISIKIIAQTNSTDTKIEDIPAMEAKAQSAKFRSVLSGAANTYDLKYHRCVWEVDPSVYFIKGNITSYFKPTVSNFNKMEFDLSIALTVDSVKYHNSNLAFTQLSTDILQIDFSSTLPSNVLDSVTVYYQGSPTSTGFGSFAKDVHSGTPIIWTLSEPFGAKEWWPCKQDLNDKIDSVDIIVTTPQANRVGSNGVLLSELHVGTNKIYHWKTKYPIAAYLVAIAITNYVAYSDYVPLSNGSLEVLNYVYPESLLVAQSRTPDIINVIQFYDSLTIEYPFAKEKYGHAEFGWGGGMEHQTMTFIVGFSHSLMAHECAHQWFGDWVTCGSWQDIWLNEGFATYFEGLTEERFFSDTWMQWKREKIANITSAPDGSVLCDDTTSVNRIFNGRLTYNKGSYLLHMLRWKLGDAQFFQGLKNYLNDPLLAGGYAKTPDLKAHLETVSGQNLTNFFNEWYYNQGFPSYQIGWSQNGNAVTVTIGQTQSHSSVSFYEMPVPIKFIGVGKDTTIVFDHQFSGQVFSATINFPVLTAEFDPELHILSANNTITGVPDITAFETIINTYPNPTKNTILVNIQLKNTEELLFELFDITGRKIISKKENTIAGSSIKLINTESLSSGIYVLKIKGKEINYSQKIVKE